MWEFVELRLENYETDLVSGQYFDAINCKFIQPTSQQKEYIENIVFYGE